MSNNLHLVLNQKSRACSCGHQLRASVCWKHLLPACSAPLTVCPASPSISLDFVYDLFERVQSRNKQDTLRSSSKHRRPTVSSQFKVGLLQVAPLATLHGARTAGASVEKHHNPRNFGITYLSCCLFCQTSSQTVCGHFPFKAPSSRRLLLVLTADG